MPCDDLVRRAFAYGSGGKEYIDLQAYSAVVLVGMEFRFDHLIYAYMELRTDQHHNPHKLSEGELVLVSHAVFEEAILGRLRAQPFFQILERVRDAVPVVWGIPQPRASDKIFDPQYANDDRAASWRAAAEYGDDAALSATFDRLVGRLAEPPGFQILQQPRATLAGGFFTDRRHSEDPSNQDYYHMNGDYGALVIAELFPRLASSLGRR